MAEYLASGNAQLLGSLPDACKRTRPDEVEIAGYSKKMHAAVLRALGGPPRYESFPDPYTPGPGDTIILHVRAASLKNVDRLMAAGTHYASPRKLPAVCGVDGVGVLDDGTRVFFGGPRPPCGPMAERAAISRARPCSPVPTTVLDDATAAALPKIPHYRAGCR